MEFTPMELAALRSIFSETPEHAAALERQIAVAIVTARENTGGGFYTDIAVPDRVPLVEGHWTPGEQTLACIDGFPDPIHFILSLEEGKVRLLEGYTFGSGSTAAFDLANLRFKVTRSSMRAS
ncbi:hypothetical protein [Sphingomonas sp.]|jgi:hypothetical protein|uniref:hypothetical protein n=1 Tax=Sphingomonas sp. TaxID=28214 RepID=UPI002EDB4626